MHPSNPALLLRPPPKVVVAGGSYSGPGDVVSGALAWYGLRAYSAATIGANAVRLVRASDSTQQDFVTLTDGSLDIASITTFLTSTTGKIVTLYNQANPGTNDATQATAGNRPLLTLSALGGFAAFDSNSVGWLDLGTIAQATPFSIATVYKRGGTSGFGAIFGSDTNNVGILAGNGANAIANFGGGSLTTTASDNTWHASSHIWTGATDYIYVDGVQTTGGSGAALAGAAHIGEWNGGTQGPIQILELGIWANDFSLSSRATAMNTNQHSTKGYNF